MDDSEDIHMEEPPSWWEDLMGNNNYNATTADVPDFIPDNENYATPGSTFLFFALGGLVVFVIVKLHTIYKIRMLQEEEAEESRRLQQDVMDSSNAAKKRRRTLTEQLKRNETMLVLSENDFRSHSSNNTVSSPLDIDIEAGRLQVASISVEKDKISNGSMEVAEIMKAVTTSTSKGDDENERSGSENTTMGEADIHMLSSKSTEHAESNDAKDLEVGEAPVDIPTSVVGELNNNNTVETTSMDGAVETTKDDDEEEKAAKMDENKGAAPISSSRGSMTTTGGGEVILPRGGDENENASSMIPNLCAICLDSYHVGETVVWSNNTECQHAFHQECLLDYVCLRAIHREDEAPCPCCRRVFLSKRKNKKWKKAATATTTSSGRQNQ
jgi:hypothetical protein